MTSRKILALILALCMMVSLLCACGTKTDDGSSEPDGGDSTVATEPPLQTSDPSADDTLNILLIGHSFCYYFTDELYGMLDAAGIKARVCNLYYSGCTLESHYSWWQSDSANYQEFATVDENGRQSVSDVSLRQALAAQNWDMISLQPGIDFYNRTAAVMLKDTETARSELIGFLKQQFPMSQFYWHQFWAFQVGFMRDDYVVTNDRDQELYYGEVKYFATQTCEQYDLIRVNTGYAWQLVRNGGYDNLCARLAINNGEGDYYHDGDIGGGQYLNACVWFEYLTGESCLDNTYRPDYELSEDLITTLKAAAHQAVADRDIE